MDRKDFSGMSFPLPGKALTGLLAVALALALAATGGLVVVADQAAYYGRYTLQLSRNYSYWNYGYRAAVNNLCC
jgi:hypothetical protein